ncbi:MAG: hypothetical protein J4F45_03390 [Pseudomonadales bacterium]|nr:hypothetical protein [Pseudomonadales bacterium]
MFSAVLVWHRYIDDAWNSYLPDYELAVYDESDVLVAYSNDVTSNVELVEFELQPGSYEMKVRLISDGGSPEPLSYGLAWTTKTVCADPGDLRVVRNGDDWDLDWAIPAAEQCRKYRLEARAGSDDAEEVSEEVYLDVNSYTYAIPDDSSSPGQIRGISLSFLADSRRGGGFVDSASKPTTSFLALGGHGWTAGLAARDSYERFLERP